MFEPGDTGPAAAFVEAEADALRRLISDYLTLLSSETPGTDPAVARLLPTASLEDEAVASSFRDLTESDLIAEKRSNAQIALASLGISGGWEGPVTPDQQDAWLPLLTDLRLIIGVREGVTEEIMDKPVDPSDPAHANLLLLHGLGTLQQDLIEAIQVAARGE